MFHSIWFIFAVMGLLSLVPVFIHHKMQTCKHKERQSKPKPWVVHRRETEKVRDKSA